jgi:hypothetical protein
MLLFINDHKVKKTLFEEMLDQVAQQDQRTGQLHLMPLEKLNEHLK